MSTQTQQPPDVITQISLRQLAPSGFNPRKTFNEADLAELAETIRQQGVLQPILARPWIATADDVKRARDAGFKPKFGPGDPIHQIVAGERRSRGSIVAGKDTVPGTVRELTDADVLIIQHVENLQREGLDPLEEAEGYQTLMANGLKQEEIGKRIGKSIQYVSARAKLVSLIEDGKTLLRKKWISPGHAILVARLDAPDQERALRACFDVWGQQKKVTVMELAEREYAPGLPDSDPPDPHVTSEKMLRQWIKDNVNLELKKAPWKLDDAELYPEAGACFTCPFKSGNNQALFAEIADSDTKCMKPVCYQEKRKRFIQIEIKEAKEAEKPLQPLSNKNSTAPPKEDAKLLKAGQWVESHKGECPDTIQGIFMDGENAGKTGYVCGNVKCKKHKHHIQQPSQRSEVDHEEENRKREEKLTIERQIRFGRAVAVLKEVEGLSDAILRQIAAEVIDDARRHDVWKKLLQHAEISGSVDTVKTTSPEFAKLIVASLLAPHAEPWYEAANGRKAFHDTIISLGPEFKKMLVQWEKDPAPKSPAKKKAKPAAKAVKPAKKVTKKKTKK